MFVLKISGMQKALQYLIIQLKKSKIWLLIWSIVFVCLFIHASQLDFFLMFLSRIGSDLYHSVIIINYINSIFFTLFVFGFIIEFYDDAQFVDNFQFMYDSNVSFVWMERKFMCISLRMKCRRYTNDLE